jgi:hypothetical protein
MSSYLEATNIEVTPIMWRSDTSLVSVLLLKNLSIRETARKKV